jgi:hypothetical protein
LKRLLELFFFFFFFFLSIFFSALSLEDVGVLMIFEEKSLLQNFFSNSFNILVVHAYAGVELYAPTRLNHDYGDGEGGGGVADIFVVDAYSRVDVCMLIFMGEASN